MEFPLHNASDGLLDHSVNIAFEDEPEHSGLGVTDANSIYTTSFAPTTAPAAAAPATTPNLYLIAKSLYTKKVKKHAGKLHQLEDVSDLISTYPELESYEPWQLKVLSQKIWDMVEKQKGIFYLLFH